MQFEKKVLVLKCAERTSSFQKIPNGLARIEIENGVAELHLSLVNQPPEISGEFFALIIDGNNVYHEFALGKRPTSYAQIFSSLPEINNGVVIGVYCVKDNLPLTIVFASEQKNFALADFKKTVAEKCLFKHKQSQKNESIKQPCITHEQDFKNKQIPQEYNDEAVATENYYELDRQIQSKLNLLKENDYENLQLENELFDCASQEKTQTECAIANSFKNEAHDNNCQKDCEHNYFQRVKDELNQIFIKYPCEQTLCDLFKDSRWAKIYYQAEKYYVVGVILQKGDTKYICYGVPATYSKEPPKELAGFCSFIPLSIFNMLGAGYWIMFQDAKTGKCVHIS